MRATRFYMAVYVTGFLCVLPFVHANAQEKVIITETDTILFNIQPDAEEYRILSEFYKRTNGKKWKNNRNWLKGKTGKDMAKWYGVVVRDGDVSEIHLTDNDLSGTIPKSIYKLDGLVALSLEGNTLAEEPSKRVAAKRQPASFSQAASARAVVTDGRNLPLWGLAVNGPSVQKVDWRTTPPTIAPAVNSGTSQLGAAAVAVDGCGKLAFYVLHSGTDAPNQLHLYSENGTRLTNTAQGHAREGLNSTHGHSEIQVVQVPGTLDEWYIIYSLYQPPCLSNPRGSGYCPAKVVYARVKYNAAVGLVMTSDKREVPIGNAAYRFIQGKAVSRTVNGDATRHYLYLAQRGTATSTPEELRIHRFVIDGTGINFGTRSAAVIPAGYWVAGISGSSVELSADETKLAISNRNVGAQIKEDIIVFDVSRFNDSMYEPVRISIPELVVHGTGKTIRQLSLETQYACFRYLKNKMSLIEFSPSGRYLYSVHGGYPDNSGGRPYDTYLLQIDLVSGSATGEYDVRMQIENGDGGAAECLGASGNAGTNNYMQQIQSAYDGKLYFTKSQSRYLFVIPNPDDPMEHDLVPGVIDLATPAAPNIAMLNGATVLFMPENIDGHDYMKEIINTGGPENFTLDKTAIGPGESILLTIVGFNALDSYQVAWGDGVTESLTSATGSHTYHEIGDHKITLTMLDHASQCGSITSKILPVEECPDVRGLVIEKAQYLCAMKFSVPKRTDCPATYDWNFGDGSTHSLKRSPMHVYATTGTYEVSVTVKYDCESCHRERTITQQVSVNVASPVLESRLIQIPSDRREEVISSAVTTFSDHWPLEHNSPSLVAMNGFVNGARGVWRSEGTYVYNTPRSAPSLSSPLNIKTDGTYTLDYFNWAGAHFQAIPNWVKANTTTRYSAFGFELENRDVLDIYTAALYDYGGQLQSAHGTNMRHEEMAFTGFESMSTGFTTLDSKPTGNFIFNNPEVPAYRPFTVSVGLSHTGVVEATLQDLQHVETVDIVVTGYGLLPDHFVTRLNTINDVKILCRQVHPTNPNWTLLVFEEEPFPLLWTGEIRARNTIAPAAGVIDMIAHTGKKSLKITAEKLFEQKLLRLEAGKDYHFSAWVSINNAQVMTPKLSNNLGVDVVLKNRSGKTISTTLLVPEGRIIEGWQQVKGSFTCPEKDLVLSLRFKPGSTGTSWYDDVRLHPDNGNMKSYVYDIADFKLRAILDEDNFASLFYYDREGILYLTKKETEEGIKTITENISYQDEQ